MNRVQFRQAIRDWANRDDWSDSLVDSWIDMATQELSDELRVSDQVIIATQTIELNRVLLPADWKEGSFIRIVGGAPLRVKDRDQFYRLDEDNVSAFTISGNFLIVKGEVDDSNTRELELHYFGGLPTLEEAASNWVTSKYLKLYLFKTLTLASAFGVEDERAVLVEQSANSMIEAFNEAHRNARFSGSALIVPKGRGFN